MSHSLSKPKLIHSSLVNHLTQKKKPLRQEDRKKFHSSPRSLSQTPVASHIFAIRKLLEKRKILLTRKVDLLSKGDSKSGWFDSKGSLDPVSSIDQDIAEVDRSIQLMKEAARSVLAGDRKLLISLPALTSFNLNGSGVSNGVFLLDPSGLGEFSSIAAIFDEYRVTGCLVDSLMCNGATAATGVDPWHAVCYDPADSSPMTSVTSVLQHEQHILQNFAVASGSYAVVNDRTKRWMVEVPHGVLSNGVTGVGASNWQPTNSGTSFLPYGFFKAYGTSSNVSQIACSQIWYMHVEFRIRT
jgi:hypothetical protein